MSKTTPRTARKRKTLMDLERCDCRWPIGEPRQPDFHFCAEPQAPGRPYCARHWDMAFQQPRPRHPQRPQPSIAPPPNAKAA